MTHGYGKIRPGDVLQADQLASKWLADANEAEESGNHVKAAKCFEKAQFWLDRYNKLAGNL